MKPRYDPRYSPVRFAKRHQAGWAMTQFVADLHAAGHWITAWGARPEQDYNTHYADGRFAFEVEFNHGRAIQVQMPGVNLHKVRYMNLPHQNIWDFPELYVNGRREPWMFALNLAAPIYRQGNHP